MHSIGNRFVGLLILVLATVPLATPKVGAAENGSENRLADTPTPLDPTILATLSAYCFDCHNAQKTEAELNLAALSQSGQLAADAELLDSMLEVVSEGLMPPAKAKPLEAADRDQLVTWLEKQLERMAQTHADDPGRVVLRRLTNAELNYTLTDLTGIQRDWTQSFPRDSSGGEGFSNTGQTLQMSASQLEKYLALAQQVVNHALMLPGSGPVFLETPVSTLPDVERARIALTRLDEYCRDQGFSYTDITPAMQIASYAYPDAKRKSRPPFQLMTGYKAYSSDVPGAALSFVGSTHRLFYRTELLNPTPFSFMIHRGHIKPTATDANTPYSTTDTWNDLWFDLRFATGFARPAKISLLHRWLSHQAYRLGDNPAMEHEMGQWKVSDGKSPDGYKRYSLNPESDLSFTVIALAGYLNDLRSFPKSELEVYANIQQSGDGESRTLMLPNHDAFDAFIQQSLNDEQTEKLWQMVCDPDTKLAKRLGDVPPLVMQREWEQWTLRHEEWKNRVVSDSQDALCRFAAAAWRRPLDTAERDGLRNGFAQAFQQGGSVQAAMELPLFRILMSPHFLYRMEFGAPHYPGHTRAVQELNADALAARLSYFLWSSTPDEPLRRAAAAGSLSRPHELTEQTRRMSRHPRIRRFALEFFGQWLGFYRFLDDARPDVDRFPEFDDELRKAMQDEAIDFCTDLIANDRDIRLLLRADHSFLPSNLAEHYGIVIDEQEDPWANFKLKSDALVTAPRVSLQSTSRRGVLGWGATLTSTSHPLRTSPVLRGNWILDDLLGIPTPPPPNAVPELPNDERNDSGLSVSELLAGHREQKACAVCHDRIDPLGLALENYDPIGSYRKRDLNGAEIDSTAKLHDGTALDGPLALSDYLGQADVQDLFVRRFCEKMLGYGLGRAVLPGDTRLLDEIERELDANGYRVSVVIESIVKSKQFRQLRIAE